MADQPLEPRQLVVEFETGLRIAIRQVETPDEGAVHRGLDVVALRVVRIARKFAPRQYGLHAACEDRDTIP